MVAVPATAAGEQASEPTAAAAGTLDAGGQHTCSLDAGAVRCWGLGFSGQLGYGNQASIGDNETPGSAGLVDLGPGRSATAISAGDFHTCALLDNGSVRCWGFGGDGRLGYGNLDTVGDDETPGSVGPVNLGIGRTAKAISAGGAHTCAVLDTNDVLCWGFGKDGRLGYGDSGETASIGDDELPGSVAPVQLGTGRTATAVSAGGEHTCALLDDGSVRCWGTNSGPFQGDGRLGYGNANAIGDNETPGSVDPVDLGATATAISAGTVHTCAVLNGGSVRCWGSNVQGRLGYAIQTRAIGDDETPASVGPIELGGPATAITAGNHTCARLDSGAVRCWGPGSFGRLGYSSTNDVGDNETPASLPPVSLGGPATAISAAGSPADVNGGTHTCARLADSTLRCWGDGRGGRLGYGNESNVGDDETPASVGAVLLRPAFLVTDVAVIEGDSGETVATFTVRLSAPSDVPASVTYATADDSARAPSDYTPRSGALTFAPGETSKTIAVPVIGDTVDEADERFVLNLSAPSALTIADPQGAATIFDDDTPPGPPAAPADANVDVSVPPPASPAAGTDTLAEALRQQTRRAADLRACRASATSKRRSARAAARRRYRQPRVLAHVLRGINRTAAQRRTQCLRRFGRTPGRVKSLVARRASGSRIVLAFDAVGSDGSKAPAARGYVVKQSLRPIRTTLQFDRATSLCGGTCRFDVARPGDDITVNVTRLRRRTTYYYAVAARDNVSARRGPRSKTVSIRTR